MSLARSDRPGRYALHDLLREYAGELSSEDIAQAAVDRVLDHYLYTAAGAALRLNPSMIPLSTSGVPAPAAIVEDFASAAQADRWIEDDLTILNRTLTLALRWNRPRHAALLPAALALFLDKKGSWTAYHDTQLIARDAVRTIGDDALAARAEAGIGRALIQTGDRDAAISHLNLALTMYGALDDRGGVARTAMGLARAHGDEAPDEAVRLAHRALSEYRKIDDRAGQANALNSVAWFGARAGRYAEALLFAEQALALQQQLDAGFGEGEA